MNENTIKEKNKKIIIIFLLLIEELKINYCTEK